MDKRNSRPLGAIPPNPVDNSGTGNNKTELKIQTRSASKAPISVQYEHPILGPCDQLQMAQLPLTIDIIRYGYYLKEKETEIKRPVLTDFISKIVDDLTKIWESASIPIMEEHCIDFKIRRVFTHDDLKNINKNINKHKDSKDYKAAKVKHYSTLFNIAFCKCYDSALKDEWIVGKLCKCPQIKRIIIQNDLNFLYDQMYTRKMVISMNRFQIDFKGSAQLNQQAEKHEKRIQRLERDRTSLQKRRAESSTKSAPQKLETYANLDTSEDIPEPPPPIKRTRIDYSRVAEVAARYQVPERVALAIANATIMSLEDASVLNKPVAEIMPSRHKIRNENVKVEQKVLKEHNEEFRNIFALKFDSRKDANTKRENNTPCTEEHMSVVSEPGGKFEDLITLWDGKARTVSFELLCLMREKKWSPRVIGCDGTNVNTGTEGGVIKLLEDETGDPYFWDVCMLHLLELPFKALFAELDGGTLSGDKYKGPIGKQFNKDSYPPAVAFQKVPGKVPIVGDDLYESFNKDMRLLYDLAHAVQSGPGQYPTEVMARKVGKVHQARWYNRGSVILRIYVSTEPKDVTPSLQRLANFTVNWFVPSVLRVKTNRRLQDGAKNFFFSIQLAKQCLIGKEVAIFKKVFQNNSYFAHPEAILLAALFDNNLDNRAKAVDMINADRARRSEPGHQRRIWKKPIVNFEATSYLNICDFSKVSKEYITEPPATFDLTEQDFQRCVLGNDLPIPDIPCESTNNERAVQASTIACTHYATYEKRLANIFLTLKSRGKTSTNATKEDFMN